MTDTDVEVEPDLEICVQGDMSETDVEDESDEF